MFAKKTKNVLPAPLYAPLVSTIKELIYPNPNIPKFPQRLFATDHDHSNPDPQPQLQLTSKSPCYASLEDQRNTHPSAQSSKGIVRQDLRLETFSSQGLSHNPRSATTSAQSSISSSQNATKSGAPESFTFEHIPTSPVLSKNPHGEQLLSSQDQAPAIPTVPQPHTIDIKCNNSKVHTGFHTEFRDIIEIHPDLTPVPTKSAGRNRI